MSIRVAIHHKTTYQYDRAVDIMPHVFRLRPAPHCRTPVQAYSLKIEPANHFINWQQDPFGNYVARVVFPEPARKLSFEVEVIAEMTVINPFDFFVEDYAEKFPFAYTRQQLGELSPYLEKSEDGPLLGAWVKQFEGRPPQQIVDFLVGVNQRLSRDIHYNVRMEPGVQTCEETLQMGSGSCRDTGWLLVQILRHLGLAARFVSGYLVQLAPDVKALDGPSGTEVDFTDLHAWAEVYIPGAGWIGLDPTSGLMAGEGHLPLACTPDPISAAPVTGSTGVCQSTFSFANEVKRIHEDPRVTKPYSEYQWAAINALGRLVDEKLVAGDVRMTMGGEPTFVSIDDTEGEEWNTAADGKHKRALSHDLLKRLHARFGQGGALLYGEGKWYPGEPLPRWALSCFWRKDGEPVWRNPQLLADTSKDLGHTIEDAERFTKALASELRVDPSHIRAGFEDAFYYLWRESTLPVDVDPHQADLDDPLERKYLADLLDRGLKTPAGYALPLRWSESRGQWRSTEWKFRRAQMFLVPGGSAMGMRMPLDSLVWTDEDKKLIVAEKCPLEPVKPLPVPTPQENMTPLTEMDSSLDDIDAIDGTSRSRSAICVEPRNGRLHIFMPPAGDLEHYLSLLAALESAASKTNLPLVLEGYEPPRDGRIDMIKVTPDPGVIEVNVHPSASWDMLVETTTTLYEEARLARLGTEKFNVDGRHTGTGGGNHITIGGATPADSPFLRRPSLLRSLVTYWQHHPGLSYLFSGIFVGPTSQAPRVDEGRDEKLYELEIAFQQLSEDWSDQPWVVDRALRNLLTDLTGNTHRSEFCIDKLYSPDSLSGRLGIVEFRAFEMPPHYQMSLMQASLLRALIAWMWDNPYHHKLVRWGTELHDRFMLPHFVREDLKDVVADLQGAGFPFQMDWLEPFFEFRFPVIGTVLRQGIELEMRVGIEPWHVLGEEATGSGTARYVDSSVERLQVHVRGMVDERHVVTCNGRRLPFYPAGIRGEFVTGVRYKAWAPYSALHPNIGVQTPLVFDVIDTWNGQSVGGCVYHVAHPGGRNYDTRPVNAYEAEGRRISRFWQEGHTQGAIEAPPEMAVLGRFFDQNAPPQGPTAPPPEETNPDYPVTLDLRHDGRTVTRTRTPFAG